MKSSAKNLKKFFKGQYISGVYQKSDGNLRSFWGKIMDTPTENCVTYFDSRIKDYRRFNTNNFYYICNKTVFAVGVPFLDPDPNIGMTVIPHFRTKKNSKKYKAMNEIERYIDDPQLSLATRGYSDE
jgi:hypothetical protein